MTELGIASATFNTITALCIIAIAQSVTRDFSTASELGWVKIFHRMAFLCLAGVLMYSVYKTIDTEIEPRVEDVLIQIAMMGVMVISYIRHRMAPKHNRDEMVRRMRQEFRDTATRRH